MSSRVLGLDPGPEQTALAWFDGVSVGRHDILANEDILAVLAMPPSQGATVFCEDIASYGMAVGATVFHTCRWIGRFWQIAEEAGHDFNRVPRLAVKVHHCKSAKAKDANIRQALLDRIGEQGTKKSPGPTYGVRSHEWAALAIAVYGYDQISGRSTNGGPPI
jgi:hypothetical protein